MGLEELLAGHLLSDRYRVESVIGRGGMGVVYRATDTRLERDVAVKVITAASGEIVARARMRERFQREARAIARLQHPNVVVVHDFGSDARLDIDFLVMELLRGEDLATRLNRVGKLPLALSSEIVVQAAHGLSAGHDAGIVHRDIKPGNLYLRQTGLERARIALLDFGIVKLAPDGGMDDTMTHLTVFGRAPHSPAYAAPEQLQGDSDLTPACDVWALGVTTFQMMTGEKPFSEADLARVLRGGSYRAPSLRERNGAVPAEIDLVLRKALAVRPADRFSDARAFGSAFEEALDGSAGSTLLHQVESGFIDVRRDEDHTLLAQTRPERPAAAEHWRSPFHSPPRQIATIGGEGLRKSESEFQTRRSEETVVTSANRVALQPPEPTPMPVVSARRGRLRRAAAAAWNAVVTIGSLAVAAALGFAFFTAHDRGLVEPFYASAIGLTVALPWAMYRVFGRRGSFALALLGSALTGVVTFRFVAPLAGTSAAVVILPLAQMVMSAWLLRLTRRREADPPVSPSLSL